MHQRKGKTMHTELDALILAESAAAEAFNAAEIAHMSAKRAYDASWRQRWGGAEEAHANLVSARKTVDEALKALNKARFARLFLAVYLDPRACEVAR